MKWDFCSITQWGLDQSGPDQQDLFTAAVVDLARRLGGQVDSGPLLNGYTQGFQITRNDEEMVKCLTGGTGSAAGSSQFIAANTAHEVYPVLQEMFPKHCVTRLDAAEDYCGNGVFERLVTILTDVCREHRVSMSPFGEGHTRPDGTRDSTKGRSWYCGSKDSVFRVVLYEKGLEQIAKGIPADPTWCRLELRIRPKSKAKSMLGKLSLVPSDLFGMSSWGESLGSRLGLEGIERLRIGSVWRPSDTEQMALKIVRMFDRGLDHLLEQSGSHEAVGRLLFAVQAKAREAKSLQAFHVQAVEEQQN